MTKQAKKLEGLADNPGEDLEMPVTPPVEKPAIMAGQINGLLDAIKDPHDRSLMTIGLSCALRTSGIFGLKWNAHQGNRIIIETKK